MSDLDRIGSKIGYCAETGEFWWRASRVASRVGKPAGHTAASGYLTIRVDGVLHPAHRIAFLLMTGEWPKVEIDHINGVKDDNRWCNLREATKAENQQNITARGHNTSGHIGVVYCKQTGKWKATIVINKRSIWLGRHATPEAAGAAYLRAKTEHHKFSPTPRVRA